jgi:hypothetical protein
VGGCKWDDWPRGLTYEEFSWARPPTCFPDNMQVLHLPTRAFCAEVELYFPAKRLLLTADFIQCCDHGEHLSELRMDCWSRLIWYRVFRDKGILKTPPLLWLSVLDYDLEKVYAFHDQLMALDFNKVIPSHGGPVLRDAKLIRAENLANWPDDVRARALGRGT